MVATLDRYRYVHGNSANWTDPSENKIATEPYVLAVLGFSLSLYIFALNMCSRGSYVVTMILAAVPAATTLGYWGVCGDTMQNELHYYCSIATVIGLMLILSITIYFVSALSSVFQSSTTSISTGLTVAFYPVVRIMDNISSVWYRRNEP